MNTLFDEASPVSISVFPALNSATYPNSAKAVCKRGSFCTLRSCKKCNARRAASAERHTLDYVAENLPTEDEQREHLFFATVLVGCCELTDLKTAKALAKNARLKIKTLSADYPSFWRYGSFEIEVVRCGTHEHRKTEAIRDLLSASGIRKPVQMNSYALIHFHAFFALKDIDRDDFNAALKKRFNDADRQVLLKRQYENNEVEVNIHRISNYMFKKQKGYKTDLEGKRESTPLSETDIRLLNDMYIHLQGKNGKGLIMSSQPSKFKTNKTLQSSQGTSTGSRKVSSTLPKSIVISGFQPSASSVMAKSEETDDQAFDGKFFHLPVKRTLRSKNLSRRFR